jgi:hypothetical protein
MRYGATSQVLSDLVHEKPVVDCFPVIGALNQCCFILEGFYMSDSRVNSNRQPYKGLHVFLTCQQGNHSTGLTSALYSHTTMPAPSPWMVVGVKTVAGGLARLEMAGRKAIETEAASALEVAVGVSEVSETADVAVAVEVGEAGAMGAEEVVVTGVVMEGKAVVAVGLGVSAAMEADSAAPVAGQVRSAWRAGGQRRSRTCPCLHTEQAVQ